MTTLGVSQSFEPKWSVPPGATIAAMLAARSMSREEFAALIGERIEVVHRLLLGLDDLTPTLAEQLSRHLGSSRAFWLAREAQYRADNERVEAFSSAVRTEAWVQQFPIREMAQLGWIAPYRSLREAAAECLRLFGVTDLPSWETRYGATAASAAFRISSAFHRSPSSVLAWLRWAELVASRIPCAAWSAVAFRQQLTLIRRLTWQKDPGNFLPKLRALCAAAGVAVVVSRTPKGCPASGATRFVAPNKAMIVLSFRYRSDDQFWFTFFHEAAHLLLHDQLALFLEDGGDVTSSEEEEANVFAEDILLPRDLRDELFSIGANVDAVLRFSRRAGVAPGIIVGQLQHKGLLRRDRLNGLKRKYTWDQISAERLNP